MCWDLCWDLDADASDVRLTDSFFQNVCELDLVFSFYKVTSNPFSPDE